MILLSTQSLKVEIWVISGFLSSSSCILFPIKSYRFYLLNLSCLYTSLQMLHHTPILTWINMIASQSVLPVPFVCIPSHHNYLYKYHIITNIIKPLEETKGRMCRLMFNWLAHTEELSKLKSNGRNFKGKNRSI